MAPGCAPPLIVGGEIVSESSAVGATVNEPDAEAPWSVAVIVTGVGDVTWPACIWNCVQAKFAGIVIVAGTGAALGFELVRATLVSTVGAPVSCSCRNVVSPLGSGSNVDVTDTGFAGAELTVKVPVCDHAVTAGKVGDEAPCVEFTRQNFWPDVSDSTVRLGSVNCASSSSMFWNVLSFAISSV